MRVLVPGGSNVEKDYKVFKIRFYSLDDSHIVVCESGDFWQFDNLRESSKQASRQEPLSFAECNLREVDYVYLGDGEYLSNLTNTLSGITREEWVVCESYKRTEFFTPVNK